MGKVQRFSVDRDNSVQAQQAEQKTSRLDSRNKSKAGQQRQQEDARQVDTDHK
jgi:hypothetical protein